jgi:hypothetical protein
VTRVHRIVGLPALLVMAVVAVAAAWTATAVRDCPEGRPCAWYPWLGIPAALVAVIAGLACVRLAIWTSRGRDGFAAAMSVGIAIIMCLLWLVAYFSALRV